jgi:hypothetical protein
MYLEKVRRKIIIFVRILKVFDEKSRIRKRKSVVRIRGSGSAPKSHGSTTLLRTMNHEDI